MLNWKYNNYSVLIYERNLKYNEKVKTLKINFNSKSQCFNVQESPFTIGLFLHFLKDNINYGYNCAFFC